MGCPRPNIYRVIRFFQLAEAKTRGFFTKMVYGVITEPMTRKKIDDEVDQVIFLATAVFFVNNDIEDFISSIRNLFFFQT